MIQRKSIAQHLGEYFSALRYEEITGSLAYKIKTYFLDWIGSALAGSREPPTQMMISLSSEFGASRPEATVIPQRRRHNALMAALVNAASSHVREMDDLHRPSIFHPAAPIMPAAFAVCERLHASGKELITAIITGYEVGIRAALAAGKSHYDLWHTTATCGTFGAAAASARALRLEPVRFAWALGSAGTQASGLWQFLEDGAMSKQLHTAKASFDGLLSAQLAKEGLVGPVHIFEGDKGFLTATSKHYDTAILTESLGKVFYTEQNSLKYYASCGHTHTAVQAALSLRNQLTVDITTIEAIEVYIYKQAIDLLGSVDPQTPYLAKFHIPFCVATALCYGHVGMDDFTEQRLKDPMIRRLTSVTSLHEDPSFSQLYPKQWPAEVKIRLRGGSVIKAQSHYPKGDPENPLGEDELIDKFKSLCGNNLEDQQKNQLIDMVLSLEELDDVATLFPITSLSLQKGAYT